MLMNLGGWRDTWGSSCDPGENFGGKVSRRRVTVSRLRGTLLRLAVCSFECFGGDVLLFVLCSGN
jgi:hypothetical protein